MRSTPNVVIERKFELCDMGKSGYLPRFMVPSLYMLVYYNIANITGMTGYVDTLLFTYTDTTEACMRICA